MNKLRLLKEKLNNIIINNLYLIFIIVIVKIMIYFKDFILKMNYINLITIFTFVIVLVDYISKTIGEAKAFIVKYNVQEEGDSSEPRLKNLIEWVVVKDLKTDYNVYSKKYNCIDGNKKSMIIEMEQDWYKLSIISKQWLKIELETMRKNQKI